MRTIPVTTPRLLTLLVALLASLTTFAQSPSGTVKGAVKSPSGTPLSRVSVQAANSGKATSTDENGLYTLTLPAGNYEISYSAPGHTPQTVAVTITPGATIVQDIVLAAQAVSVSEADHIEDDLESDPPSSTLPSTAHDLTPEATIGVTPVLSYPSGS